MSIHYHFDSLSFRDDMDLRDPKRLRRLCPAKWLTRLIAYIFALFGLGSAGTGLYLLATAVLLRGRSGFPWVSAFSCVAFIVVGTSFILIGLQTVSAIRHTLVHEHLSGAVDFLFGEGELIRVIGRRKTQDEWVLTVEGTFEGSNHFSADFEETLWRESVADPADPHPGDDKLVRLPIPCRVLYRSPAPESGMLVGIPEETVIRLKLAAEAYLDEDA